MALRILPVTLLAALGLLLAWPVADARAQAPGSGTEPLPKFDADNPAYRGVQREPSLGRDHVDGPVDYGTEFPTSGPHSPTPARPGFHDKPVPPEALVHSLEHGNIVIYYDMPGDAAMKLIRGWAGKFTGDWDGVIAVPHKGLGKKIVLTAWRHRLELSKIDARAAVFIDTFRGRGPEHNVRPQ